MAKCLLSVWHDGEYEVEFSSKLAQRLMVQVGAFNQQLIDAGALVFAEGLMPASSATFAQPDGTVTAGPYNPHPRQMGGFWVVEAADPATADRWLLEASAACEGVVELRPMQDNG